MAPSETSSTTASTSSKALTPRRLYGILAIAETITWTLLIIGMLLKYVAQIGDWPVTIGGGTHGVIFVAYAFTAGLVGVNQRWTPLQIVGAVATAIVPYATIPFDRSLERRGMLEGGWRREKTDDPRDATWVSAWLRFFLRHPALLSILLVVAVGVVFGTLLTLGPPTEWGS
ncbi:DUF3817 domain-containing protein [Paramicrobacterium fandaimingii]|uniref:DUF3817 domain-containing protein n=1 Tax=Paramicrobacterium fandaimingii TaxID=2708079 RepID=UPI0014226044|nr:DUF3817 domain-containing protein [Microbacterium fandaimingii]